MTHEIKSLTIKNYCSCKDLTVNLSRYTSLVGYNNAGKSNIIEAMYWLLKKSTLSEAKFNDLTEAVIVEATVGGINDDLLALLAPNHKKAIEPYLVDGCLKVRRRQPEPNCKATQIVFEIKKNNEDDEGAWGKPGGIENAIKELFPEPISIKAMDDATGDVSKVSKSNTIGRLISEIIQPIEEVHGGAIRTVLEGIDAKLSYDGNERAEELNAFDREVTQKLSELFPGLNLKLHVPTPNIDEIFKSGTLKVFEDGYGSLPKDLTSLGHGAQRSIQMALIRQLAEVKRSSGVSFKTTLLLIDEPELYLHPQAIEHVRVALKRLTTEGYQVVFSTHAAQMIPSEDVANALLIHKNSMVGTKTRQKIHDVVQEIVTEPSSQLDVLFALTNSSQILFSEIVLLSEGKTERKLLPKVYKKLIQKTLGENKIALVEQQGVDNTSKSLEVLRALDIPSKALVDLDYAFRGALKSGILESDDEDIEACKNCLAVIADEKGISLCEQGLPKKGGGLKASDGFRILALEESISENLKSIHQKLLHKNIWVWTKGAIEEHLGNEAKDEARLAFFIQKLERENPRDLFDDYDSVKSFCDWLVV